MREIITLQCGERSNYLATHFWNVQVRLYFSNSVEPGIDLFPLPPPLYQASHFRLAALSQLSGRNCLMPEDPLYLGILLYVFSRGRLGGRS
jgi:hypothetical protein